jgi:hypothetical protein
MMDVEDVSSHIQHPIPLGVLASEILDEIWIEPGGGVIGRVEGAEAEEDDGIYDFLMPICFCKQGRLH